MPVRDTGNFKKINSNRAGQLFVGSIIFVNPYGLFINRYGRMSPKEESAISGQKKQRFFICFAA